MNTQKRRLDLDLIRVLAFWMILTFHFMGAIGRTDSVFYGYRNGGWGSVGSTLFFILSGFLLYLKQPKVENLPAFYKKRALAILPMQIVVFLLGYLIHSIDCGNFRYGGELWRMIYSFLGIDAYLGFYNVPSYYVIGEWFTAIILLDYILYPLLSILMEKAALLTTVLLAALYFLNIHFHLQNIVADASVFTGVFLFWVGMLLVKLTNAAASPHPTTEHTRGVAVRYILCAIACMLILVITCVKLPAPDSNLPWKNLLGLAIFVLFLLAGPVLETHVPERIRSGLQFLSNIGFAVYLVHHFVMGRAVGRFGYLCVSDKRVFAFYCVLLVVILVLSTVINYIVKRLLRTIS